MNRILQSFSACLVLWPALLFADGPRTSGEQMGQMQTELERLKEENSRTRAVRLPQ